MVSLFFFFLSLIKNSVNFQKQENARDKWLREKKNWQWDILDTGSYTLNCLGDCGEGEGSLELRD